MPTMIYSRLDPATAVRLSLAGAGIHYVQMTADALAGLTDEEREALARYATSEAQPPRIGSTSPLDLIAAPTPEGVIASLRAQLAAFAARAAKEREEREERIVAALAAPDADWIKSASQGPAWYSPLDGYRHGMPRVCAWPSIQYLNEDAQRDPRVLARCQEVEARALPAALAEWERHYAAWQRDVERRKAEEAAQEAAEQQEIEGWVREHGSERLRMALDAGLLDASLTVYREERLMRERPGWEYDDSRLDDIHNPTAPALRALIEARKVDPAVRLGYVRHSHDEDCEPGCDERGGVYLAAEFLGRGIRRRVEE